MGNPIKVSVVIPVYNAGECLISCVNSVLSQTMREIELILVDDGSTDDSGRICDSFLADGRVKVIHQKNAGPGEARNVGISAASGEFIGFADADDIMDPGMYSTLYDAALSTGSDMAFCDYIFCTRQGNKKIKSDVSGDKTYDKSEISNEILPYFFGYGDNELKSYKDYCPFADYSSYLWLCIYKNSVIKDNELRLPNQRTYFNEDNLFNLCFLLHAKTVTHVSKALYFYRDNDSSLTKRFFSGFLNAKLKKFEFLREFIKENNLDDSFYHRLKNKICIESINIINYYVNSSELSSKEKYTKIAETLKSDSVSDAFAELDLNSAGYSKLRVFLFLEKYKLYRLLFMLTFCYNIIRKIKNRAA